VRDARRVENHPRLQARLATVGDPRVVAKPIAEIDVVLKFSAGQQLNCTPQTPAARPQLHPSR